MVAAYFAPTMSEVNQQDAQANLANQQSGLVAQQTTGADIQNQNAQIDLSSKKAMIQAQRETLQKFNQPQAQQAPAQQAQPQAQQAPVSDNSTDAQPTADQPNPADPYDYVHSKLASAPRFPNGQINMLSEDYVSAASKRAMELGANPQDIQAYQYNSMKNRQDMAKQASEIYKNQVEAVKTVQDTAKSAQDTQKAYQDTQTAAQAAQTATRDNNYNTAYEIKRQMEVSGGDPTTVTNSIQKAHQVLGIDLTTKEGQSQLTQMADSSANSIKMQDQYRANTDQARKNADTASEITFRRNQNGIAQQNANISAGQLAVAQGRLSSDNYKEAATQQEGAVSSARSINKMNQLQGDIDTASKIISSGQLQRGPNGAYYVSTQHMDPGLIKSLLTYAGGSGVHDNTIQVDNLFKRIGSGITEVNAQAGARGMTGSDSRMKLAEDAVAGTGLDLTKNSATMLDSLNYVKQNAQNEAQLQAQKNTSANAMVQHFATDPRTGQSIFTPITAKVYTGQPVSPGGPNILHIPPGGQSASSAPTAVQPTDRPTYSLQELQDLSKSTGLPVMNLIQQINAKGGKVQ